LGKRRGILTPKFKHNPRVVACSPPGTQGVLARQRLLALELEGLPPAISDRFSAVATSYWISSDVVCEAGVARIRLSGAEEAFRSLGHRVGGSEDLAHLSAEIAGTIDSFLQRRFTVRFPGGQLWLGERTLVMGALNVTPDSFSDGGLFLERNAAVEHGLEMAELGADIVDIGAESTRPGAEPVPLREELDRVIPVIEGLAPRLSIPISIDTYKSAVARAALEAGARIVNDISALRFDRELASVASEFGAPVILMHMKGTPRDMQKAPAYRDVVSEIIAYLRESLALAVERGIDIEQTIIDPGIGFGKTVEHNLEIIHRLREFASLGRPLLIGTSRKSFIGKLLGLEVGDRIFGTAATVAAAALAGAHIVRVHDVAQMRQVSLIADAVLKGSPVQAARETTSQAPKQWIGLQRSSK